MNEVKIRINNQTLEGKYVSDRPYATELETGTYAYDLQEDSKGRISWLVNAAYRHRVGTVILKQKIDVNKRCFIQDICFLDQLVADVKQHQEAQFENSILHEIAPNL